MDRDDDARSLHLTRLARTLAQRHGIEVRFARHGPVAQHDLLVLPDTLLAGDVDDDAITGLVDLYAARIRFGAIDDLAALASPAVQAIAQAIDDWRTTGCLAAIYPGAMTFLQRMRVATAADTLRRWPRMAWRDRLVWRIERALWSEPPPSIERVPSLDATMAAAGDLVDAARAATTTADSIRAAHRIVERVRALASAGANNMMFTADPGSTIDSDSIAAEFESDGQGAPDDSRAPVSAESGAGAIADTASSTEAPTPGDAAPHDPPVRGQPAAAVGPADRRVRHGDGLHRQRRTGALASPAKRGPRADRAARYGSNVH